MDAANSKKTVVGRPFVKGQSGNPSGRPKLPAELKTKLRKGADKGIAYWLELVSDGEAKPEYRIRAAENLVAYAYGKPAQAVDITTDAVTIKETLNERLEVVSRALTAPPEAITQLLAAQQCIYAEQKEPDIVNEYSETNENMQKSE
jgi:hypothetical protein